MEIKPASLAQVQRVHDGRLVEIENDVSNVASDLRRIDPTLRLRYSEAGECFIVYQLVGPQEEQLVTTAQECDQRLVRRVEQVTSPSYSLVDDLDATDARAEREATHAHNERMGPMAEQLAHAIRKDTVQDTGLGKNRIFVPGRP